MARIMELRDDRKYNIGCSLDAYQFTRDVAQHHGVQINRASDLVIRFVMQMVRSGRITMDDLLDPGAGPSFRFTPEARKVIDDAIDEFADALRPAGFDADRIVAELKDDLLRMLLKFAPPSALSQNPQESNQ